MGEEEKSKAKKEINHSLFYCNFFLRRIGLSVIDDIPKTYSDKFIVFFTFFMAFLCILSKVVLEYAYIVCLIIGSYSLEELIGSSIHIAGYDTNSFGKLLTMWYQTKLLRQIVNELSDIWPVSENDAKAAAIKKDSLTSLRTRQVFYLSFNVVGVWVYNLTPVVVHLYHLTRGLPSDLGYVWHLYYPFDKTKPIVHEFVYLYETIAGVLSVCGMVSSDLLFIIMASHIAMLLRLLQERIRLIGKGEYFTNTDTNRTRDCYKEIEQAVKVHQRLIRYGNDLENAFCVVNLINVLFSSVNICLVLFNIVLIEPMIVMGTKFYLLAVMTQMGIVCWYADDICRASLGVSDAVYDSGWYQVDVRSRRALLLMLRRSQKPLYFTALKFRPITMKTFSSILTTSYSYFALLYSAYNRI